jgi:cyclic pyranopterin monophosphate synthase
MADLDAAIFPFEDVLPELEFVPLAARRALDLAGVRLTLEGWRSLRAADRKALIVAGAPDDVDVERVFAISDRASPTPTRIAPASDPDPLEPPEALVRALGAARIIDPRRWVQLRALERYALMHGYRRSVTKGVPNQLEESFDVIVCGAKPRAREEVVGEPPSSRDVPSSKDLPVSRELSSSRDLPSSRDPASSREPGSPRGQHSPGAYSVSVSAQRAAGTPIGQIRHSPMPPSPRSPPTEPAITLAPAVRDAPRGPMTHVNKVGEINMVGVGEKPATARRAIARAAVRMRPETAALVATGAAAKGEVLAAARIAGILAAKRTPEIIPLCHGVALTRVAIELDVDPKAGRINVVATAEAIDRTGVEMEAMVAVSVACLTLYDMLKSTDRDIEIESVLLVEKSGGKTGHWIRADRG